ncbi:survival protein sure-likephosphatase/nucleotidase-like protein [Lasiosphaeris hirsuta]|uniref:Survival protein sure-likephosphatase/nucleotidase-like protein n=1 Tax=Lasiosphaeris hirsuta TaxID=260670 RepID=A0AA39ZVW0_9PEZI|nr:survival protein sure-likephosphatase/nucleotidase-like protein [Lasiosphaeris hirsuta]
MEFPTSKGRCSQNLKAARNPSSRKAQLLIAAVVISSLIIYSLDAIMHLPRLLVLLSPLSAHAVRIIQSNDDGWAELYVRSFHDALVASGHDVVLSAPAENRSGSSSLDVEPRPRTAACQYASCPAASGQPLGRNATSPRLHWVNSFPVTAMRYGIDTLAPPFWGGAGPDLAVSGPNVGSNLFLQVPFSGTVGTAVYAVAAAGIPAIAFSGASDGTLPWDTVPVPARSAVYAELAARLTNAVIAGGKPYLPPNVWLNVNFPEITPQCGSAGKFKWVLSRINPGLFSPADVLHCGGSRLPTETDVMKAGGCYVSVSVGDATDKSTAPAARQADVLKRLGSLLSCLP